MCQDFRDGHRQTETESNVKARKRLSKQRSLHAERKPKRGRSSYAKARPEIYCKCGPEAKKPSPGLRKNSASATSVALENNKIAEKRARGEKLF
jgi:hypothetical protein